MYFGSRYCIGARRHLVAFRGELPFSSNVREFQIATVLDSIETMHSRPAVGPVADVGRDAGRAGDSDHSGHEAVLVALAVTDGESATVDVRTPRSASAIAAFSDAVPFK